VHAVDLSQFSRRLVALQRFEGDLTLKSALNLGLFLCTSTSGKLGAHILRRQPIQSFADTLFAESPNR
jgi:hypothetical protein